MGKTLENKKLSLILFLALWMTYCLVSMTRNTASAAMTAIVSEGILTKSQTGLITALFYLIYGILQIPGGILADKYDPEKLIRTGLIGSGIANAVIFINQSYPVMIVAWVFNAIALFALWPSVFKITSAQLAKEHRKTAVFYISIATSGGVFLSYAVAAIVPKWQYNFAFSAVIMFVVAIVFNRVYKYIQKFMVPETEEIIGLQTGGHQLTKWEIFFGSGLLLMFPAILMRGIVNQGVLAFAPTMLMESYTAVSPSTGNLLNLIIIISGVAGILTVRGFLYPKRIKNELTGWLISFVISLPFALLMLFLGKTNVPMVVTYLSVIYALMSAAFLFGNYWTQQFHKFGCEGTVAGIINSLASIGVVLASYGVGLLADNTGWISVIWLWIILIVLNIVLVAGGAVMWRRFDNVK